MQKRKNRQSIYFRAIVSLTAVAVLSVGIFFCFFYPLVLESAYKRVDERRTVAMEQTVLAMDKSLERLRGMVSLIQEDEDLRPYGLQGGDTMKLYEARRRLHYYNATLANAFALFYHVNGTDQVIGSNGVVRLDHFGYQAWLLDAIDSDTLHAMLEEPQPYGALMPVDAVRPTLQSSRSAVLPMWLPVPTSGNPYGSLLVLLRASDMAADLGRSWENEAVFITDGQRILFSTHPDATAELTAELLSEPAQGMRLDKTHTLYLSPSAYYDISYGALCNTDVPQLGLEGLRRKAAGLLLAVSAMALVSALLVSRWNYRPVQALLDSVGVEATARGRDSELLAERFHALENVNTALSENLRQSQMLFGDAVVQRFLVSAPGERDALIERGQRLGLFDPHCVCTVAVALPSAEMTNPFPKDVHVRVAALYQAWGGGHYALLVMGPADAAQRYLQSHASGMRICCTPPCTIWKEAPDAYALLLRKLHALRSAEAGKVIAWDDPRLAEEMTLPLGREALDELAESLSTQQEESLRLAISHLCSCLSEERPQHELRALTLDALCMLSEALDGQGGLDAQTLEKLNPLAQGRLEDDKRMASLLRSASEAVVSSFPRVGGSSRQSQLPQNVLLYIDVHLLEPNFSIYTVSEAFGLSESAFSHLFKRTFHQTFSTYVNQQKLVCAFELLADEDIPLEEVALRLGYSRASNFGRMFKAEVGMSPGKYRSLYGRRAADAPETGA